MFCDIFLLTSDIGDAKLTRLCQLKTLAPANSAVFVPQGANRSCKSRTSILHNILKNILNRVLFWPESLVSINDRKYFEKHID